MANESVITRFVKSGDPREDSDKSFARPGHPVPDWFFDIGVGGGCESHVLRTQWPWLNCLGVEPHPELFKESEEVWPEQLPGVRSQLMRVGAWSTPCDRQLWLCQDNPKQSSVYGALKNDDVPIEIECRPLDQICEMWDVVPQAAVLWVDVEGAELEVLRGCWRLFHERRIIACNLEVRERPWWGDACSRAQVDAFLAGFGFACVTEYNSHWHPDPHCDAIYLRCDQPKVW